MSKKKEITEEIQRICQIYHMAKECFLYSKYLYTPDTPEERMCVSRNRHFLIMALMHWRLCIVEIHKLVSESTSDKYRLRHFINKLKPEGYYRSIKISKSKIEKWEKSLKDHKELINDIRTLRDKLYAHTDTDAAELKHIEIRFSQVNELLNFTGEIIQEIYLIAFDSHYMLTTARFETDKPKFLKELAEKDKKLAELESSLFKKE